MTEHTGGHWLDTGEGPLSLDPTPEVAPTPAVAAWQAYIVHRRDCHQCRAEAFRCADGNALWNAYTD